MVIGQTPLPEPVPWLNRREDFFIGNGIVSGGGAADGSWNFLAGPDYTCPNYLSREEILLVVDGTERLITMNVHRARNTGVFYGSTIIGDLDVCLIDHAVRGEPWAARLVMIKNNSATIGHTVQVRARVSPIIGAGRSASVVRDSSGRESGISLKLDTSLKCVKGWVCQNWADRYALITFNEPSTAATKEGDACLLAVGTHHIAANGVYNVGLYHYLHYLGRADGDSVKLIRQRDAVGDAEQSIREWQSWFAAVDTTYSPERITDSRARDIVEGGLAMIRMNQARDGGVVDNERGWNQSYVRDAYCALRGLGANGHFAEMERFIQWQDHKYAVHGFIPNAAACGSDTYAHPSGNNGYTCAEANASVEVTALYLLAARDYYNATHDLGTLTNADRSLRYAMDIQLKHAVANSYKLEFNGDETELCNAVDIGATGFDRNLGRYWSMTSIALCSASLDFYIRYLKAKGTDPASYVNSQDKQTVDLDHELGRLEDALEADFWRTNLAEFPDGFHDWYRLKGGHGWPLARVVNFSLFPIYYGTPLKYPDRSGNDIAAIAHYFSRTTGFLPLTGSQGGRFLGHDLGYLLWGMIAVGDSNRVAVYDALINGPTVGCWGTYNEAYNANGSPNANGLRSFETGVNISAIAKYWGLGENSVH